MIAPISSPRGARASLASIALLACACGAPPPPTSTGGTDAGAGVCGRGFVVIETDYQSTNVSLLGTDGGVLSARFLSSASTAPGLSAPLTKDVAAPSTLQSGPRVVLLDRYPAGVLTWVDVASDTVPAQLSLNIGDFQANPQDYADIAPHVAYVSRYNPNPKAGRQPFDQGDDVLILDPSRPAVTGRIDLAPAMKGEAPTLFARPNRIVVAGDRAYVLLAAYDASYATSGASRIAVIDTKTNAIAAVTVLDGLHGCDGLALSPAPAQDRIAVACSGTFQNNEASALAESAVVVLARHDDGTLSELSRTSAATFGLGEIGATLSFAGERSLVFTTLGHDAATGGAELDDALIQLDLGSGAHQVVLRSNGQPFTIGDVSCDPACGTCLVADAGRDGGVVHRFAIRGGALTDDRPTQVETSIHLPPRYLGRF